MSHLFEPLRLRSVVFANRIGVSPMCQYSCEDGYATDWHLVHLGSRAVGGAGLVMVEASAVTPQGRISPQDLGIWDDRHIDGLERIARFIESQGSVPGIQLSHAGRKASTARPWEGRKGTLGESDGGWRTIAPSPLAFDEYSLTPTEMSEDDIVAVIRAFVAAAQRARRAGFKAIELHAAHGYLLHEFLSPLSNRRTDRYGGSFENRVRLVKDVVIAVRSVWPEELPLFIRISATDWVDGGWTVEESIELSRRLKIHGVDMIDCSSGGLIHARIPVATGYQTLFAKRVRHEAEIPTTAVGLISAPAQADHIIRTGQADFVFLAREMLRDPYWPLHAAQELGHAVPWPAQYLRAAPAGAPNRQPSAPECRPDAALAESDS